MRGRKPKPLKAQIAAGDPARKGANKLRERIGAEPKAARGLPACPEHLKGKAREAWLFWAEELALMDLDRRPDSHMLEGCCIAYEAAISCYEIIQQQGRFIAKKVYDEEKKTFVVLDLKTHPAVRQANQAWVIMRAFCSEFGLSPVSRIRLAVEKDDNSEDDLMMLLTRPRVKRVMDRVQ